MRAVRVAAESDGSVVCWLCARREPPEIYRGGWVADHDNGRLRPAHFGCNSAKGGRSVDWFRRHLAKRMPGWFG